MRVRRLGTLERAGVAEPGACLVAADRLALIVRRGTSQAAVGLELGAATIHTRWRQPLGGEGRHAWAGHHIALDVGSLVPLSHGRLFAAGGTSRLELDGLDGTVLDHLEVNASPSAAAGLLGPSAAPAGPHGPSRVLVPEGQTVSLYELDPVRRIEQRPTPPGTWVWAPPSHGYLSLEAESAANANPDAPHRPDDLPIVWSWHTNAVWRLPLGPFLRGAALLSGDLLLVPAGLVACEGVVALRLPDGDLRWQTTLAPPASPLVRQRPPLARPLAHLPNGDVVAATAAPSLHCLDPQAGTPHWQRPLEAEPTVVLPDDDTLWVGQANSRLVCVEAATGEVIDAAQLAVFAVALVARRRGEVIAIDRLASVYVCRHA